MYFFGRASYQANTGSAGEGEHPDKSIMKTNSSCEVELKLMPLYIILIFMEHLNVNSNYNFGWDADGAPAPENSVPRGRCAIGFSSGWGNTKNLPAAKLKRLDKT